MASGNFLPRICTSSNLCYRLAVIETIAAKTTHLAPNIQLVGILSILSAPPLSAFSPPETIPGALNAEEVAAVQDRAGNIHAVSISAADTGGEEVSYHFFDGDGWQPAVQVGIEVIDYSGIDLALDESGGLHATAFGATTVFYFHRPSGGSWSSTILGSTSATSTNPGPESATSIDTATASNGTVTRHIAFSGEIDGAFVLRYATSNDGENWAISTAADADIGSGLAPSISAEPWPLAGLLFTRSAPVIVYGEGTTDELRVTYLTEPFGGGAPFWSQPSVIGETVSLAAGRDPELLIEDGVAHVAYIGTAVGAPPDPRPRYHRREVVPSLISPGGQISEADERVVDSDDERQLAFALSNGAPAILFQRQEGFSFPTVEVALRTGANSWSLETALGGVPTQIAPPTGTALTSGPLGRLAAVLARSGDETTAVREADTATRPFSVEPTTNFDDSVPPDIVPDRCGGAWVTYVNVSGKVSLAHFAPDGSITEETTLDDGREESGGIIPTSVSRDQLHLARLESGRLAIAYHTTVSDFPPDAQYLHFFLLDGTIPASFEEINLSPLGGAPRIDLGVDGGDSWVISSQFSGIPSMELAVFDHEGSRRSAIEDRYTNSNPGFLGNPEIAVRADSAVILGKSGSEIAASTFNAVDDEWNHGETVASFDSAGDVPDSYDLVIRRLPNDFGRSVGATAAFAKDGTISLSERGPGIWELLPIHTLPPVADTATVRLRRGTDVLDLHLAFSARSGGGAGDLRYARFDDPNNAADPNPPAVDPDEFLSPEDPPFETADDFALAVDRFGLRYLAAIDTGAGELRVSLPRAAEDVDADGLPLFLERAFRRDPQTRDNGELLRFDYSPPNPPSGVGSIGLAYDRPAGPAEVVDGRLRTGIFEYQIEVSEELDNFFLLNQQFFGIFPDTAPSALDGAVEQRYNVNVFPSNKPSYFFRLNVSLRRDG